MKKLLLVFGFLLCAGTVYCQDYYVQITEAKKGDKFESANGEIFLYDNEFAGVNFMMLEGLKYEEKIRNTKPGFIEKEGFFLYKEGTGMKTSFIYKIGVKILDEEPPVEELKCVEVWVSVYSYSGSIDLRFKGYLQQVGW